LSAKPKAGLRLPPASAAGLCGRWIVRLFIQGLSSDEIDAALAEDDLPTPGAEQLDQWRARCIPKNFRLRSSTSNEALEALGILPFTKNTPEAEGALGVLHHARVRVVVEAGQILGVPTGALVRTIGAFLNYQTTPEILELYGNAFFDAHGVTRSQLQVHAHQRARLALTRAAPDGDDKMAARRAIAGDPRVLAASLPSSPMSWPVVLLACGYSPARRELADVVGELTGLAAAHASESLLRGGRGDERRGASYVGLLRDLHELQQMCVTPEAEISRKLSAFQVLHSSQKLKTVAQLREGGDAVTVDVQPLTVDAAE
jgi:hypothetical protein